jgi:hypothetical protein
MCLHAEISGKREEDFGRTLEVYFREKGIRGNPGNKKVSPPRRAIPVKWNGTVAPIEPNGSRQVVYSWGLSSTCH